MALPSEDILLEFLQSPTWSNSRDLLTMHPELLDPAVDELVERVMGFARDEDQPQSVREFEQQLGLLRRSRQVSVDAAFAELSGQPRAYVVEEDQGMVRQQAEDAQQYYERTGDHAALHLALNLWLMIYTELKDPAALRRVITALKEGIRLTPPDSTLQFIRIGALGYASFYLFTLTHETGEFKRNLPAVERSIPAIERRLSALDSSREGEQMLRQLHDMYKQLIALSSQYLGT
jgi:hypothetical protein